jgi:hypothetical protein
MEWLLGGPSAGWLIDDPECDFGDDEFKALMTLSKGAKSLGLQVQSVVARINFPHEETWDLYQTLRKQSKRLLSFFFKQSTKQFLYLVSPTPPSRFQAQGVNVKINIICNKANNNIIK